jgi:hypothetical protein
MRTGGKALAGIIGLAVIAAIVLSEGSTDLGTQGAAHRDTAEPASTTWSPPATRRPKLKSVRVPDIVGERLDAARDELRSRTLTTKAIARGSGGIVIESRWKVCQSEPTGGRGVKQGSRVRLIVAPACGSRPRQAGVPASTSTDASRGDTAPVVGGSLDCSEFDRQIVAQRYYDVLGGDSGPAAELDPDHDGVACEGLP